MQGCPELKIRRLRTRSLCYTVHWLEAISEYYSVQGQKLPSQHLSQKEKKNTLNCAAEVQVLVAHRDQADSVDVHAIGEAQFTRRGIRCATKDALCALATQ
jgi:hypothetical protein